MVKECMGEEEEAEQSKWGGELKVAQGDKEEEPDRQEEGGAEAEMEEKGRSERRVGLEEAESKMSSEEIKQHKKCQEWAH